MLAHLGARTVIRGEERGVHLGAVAAKLLAQGQRRGVHGVRAADLDDVFEFLRFPMQRSLHTACTALSALGSPCSHAAPCSLFPGSARACVPKQCRIA